MVALSPPEAATVLQRGLTGLATRKKIRRRKESNDGDGGFIRVVVRVRPLGEGRGESCARLSLGSDVR